MTSSRLLRTSSSQQSLFFAGSPCGIANLRSFLPNKTEFATQLDHRHCDAEFRRSFDDWLQRSTLLIQHPGYPQDRDCQKNSCPPSSIGKYVRYASLMQYHKAKIKTATGDRHVATLFDIRYSYIWRWAKGLHCDGWNCAFLSMNHSDYLKTDPKKWTDDLMREVFGYRNSKPNHAVQIILYGKLLSLLTRPSKLAEKFTEEHLVQTYIKETNLLQNRSYYPSVSMHVRQGDSCDFILSAEEYKMKKYLNEQNKRPCFSIDIYMQKLRFVRSLYGVRKVYLSTDSQEMIHRIHQRNNDIFLALK